MAPTMDRTRFFLRVIMRFCAGLMSFLYNTDETRLPLETTKKEPAANAAGSGFERG